MRMSDIREYVGIVSQKHFMEAREAFEEVIKGDAVRELNDLGYVVCDQMAEWVQKPSFVDDGDAGDWACRVICVVTDELEEAIRG